MQHNTLTGDGCDPCGGLEVMPKLWVAGAWDNMRSLSAVTHQRCIKKVTATDVFLDKSSFDFSMLNNRDLYCTGVLLKNLV